MKVISVEVANDRDLQLLLLLIKRLGLKIVNGKAVDGTKEDLQNHIAIINKGVDISKSRLQQLLDWHNTDREDRTLPFPSR